MDEVDLQAVFQEFFGQHAAFRARHGDDPERIAPGHRINRRPLPIPGHEDEDDVYSDFSGDEKYLIPMTSFNDVRNLNNNNNNNTNINNNASIHITVTSSVSTANNTPDTVGAAGVANPAPAAAGGAGNGGFQFWQQTFNVDNDNDAATAEIAVDVETEDEGNDEADDDDDDDQDDDEATTPQGQQAFLPATHPAPAVESGDDGEDSDGWEDDDEDDDAEIPAAVGGAWGNLAGGGAAAGGGGQGIGGAFNAANAFFGGGLQILEQGDTGKDLDMYDVSTHWESGTLPPHKNCRRITQKMAILQGKLLQGQLERDQKQQLQSRRKVFGEEKDQKEPLSLPAPKLHRYLVRGVDQPQEVKDSFSISAHIQRGRSMIVVPSVYKSTETVVTIADDRLLVAPVKESIKDQFLSERRQGQQSTSDQPHVFKATKFLPLSAYDLRTKEIYQQAANFGAYSRRVGKPLDFDHRHGYVVFSGQRGSWKAFSTKYPGLPIPCDVRDTVPATTAGYGGDQILPEFQMINSFHVARWPRYEVASSARPIGTHVGGDTDMMDEEVEVDDTSNEDDAVEYEYFAIITCNDNGLVVSELPTHEEAAEAYFARRRVEIWENQEPIDIDAIDLEEHDEENEAMNDADKYEGGQEDDIEHEEQEEEVGGPQRGRSMPGRYPPQLKRQRTAPFNSHSREAWEDAANAHAVLRPPAPQPRTPTLLRYSFEHNFGHICVNDAKVSPDGKYLVVVGDVNVVWICDVTMEERFDSKASQGMERKRLQPKFGPMKPYDILPKLWNERPPKKSASNGENSSSPGQQQPTTPVFEEEAPGEYGYRSMYVAFSHDSRYFAHSSDSHSRIFVWSMEKREIVQSIDTGGGTFMLQFHPTLDLLAFANWYGFVHVVQVGDEVLKAAENYGRNDNIAAKVSLVRPNYQEQHDIVMVSFRGQRDKSLRILDAIHGLGWSTDGKHLYITTKRRTLRFALLMEDKDCHDNINFSSKGTQRAIPSLFDLCGNVIREWKDQELEETLEREASQNMAGWRYDYAAAFSDAKGHGAERAFAAKFLKEQRPKTANERQEEPNRQRELLREQWDLVPEWVRQRVLGYPNVIS